MNRPPISSASPRRHPLWKADAADATRDGARDTRPRLLMGLVFGAAGLAIVGIGTGWLPMNDAGMNAPRWLIAMIGAIFALAGLAAAGGERWPSSVNRLLGAIICTAFAVIPAWIAFGAGPRRFSGRVTGLIGSFQWQPDSTGRWAFAIGAAIMTLVSLIAWLTWLRKLDGLGRLLAIVVAGVGAYLAIEVLPAEPKFDGLVDDHARIARYLAMEPDAIRKSTRNPRRWNTLPWQDTELWIQAARTRLAANRPVPPGASVLSVPRTTTAPIVDGSEAPGEWSEALWIAMGEGADAVSVGLLAHGERLYLLARAPADTTAGGYDQFRFWFHLDLSPHLTDERVFVRGSGKAIAMRSVRDVVAKHANGPTTPTRTQWHIYDHTEAASRVVGFRRYELSVDMAEAGIAPGAALPVYFVVEGDPLLDEQGKFRQRRILGRAGKRNQPLWLRVEK